MQTIPVGINTVIIIISKYYLRLTRLTRYCALPQLRSLRISDCTFLARTHTAINVHVHVNRCTNLSNCCRFIVLLQETFVFMLPLHNKGAFVYPLRESVDSTNSS